jgi:photosystem I P700 chlorophyll a apoprotein A1
MPNNWHYFHAFNLDIKSGRNLSVAPVIYPRALSITQGRAVGITHYLLGGIVTTWAFFQARLL